MNNRYRLFNNTELFVARLGLKPRTLSFVEICSNSTELTSNKKRKRRFILAEIVPIYMYATVLHNIKTFTALCLKLIMSTNTQNTK